jgi:electron transport complex protein RnfG
MMATLGLAGMCSGLALVGIFLLTLPRIERNRAEALEAAIFEVLQGATERVTYVLREGLLARFESPSGSLPKEEAVYAGYDQAGELVGFAIPAEGPGFQDTIKLIYGYDPTRRRVVGMQVLESRETPGLGDKIIKDDSFVDCFRDLAISPDVVAVKKGRKQDN